MDVDASADLRARHHAPSPPANHALAERGGHRPPPGGGATLLWAIATARGFHLRLEVSTLSQTENELASVQQLQSEWQYELPSQPRSRLNLVPLFIDHLRELTSQLANGFDSGVTRTKEKSWRQ